MFCYLVIYFVFVSVNDIAEASVIMLVFRSICVNYYGWVGGCGGSGGLNL